MKKSLYLIGAALLWMMMGCRSDPNRNQLDCQRGYAFAEGSYQNFESNRAIFTRDRIIDTINGGWKHDNLKKGILLRSVTHDCIGKGGIDISSFIIQDRDTIYIKHLNKNPTRNEKRAYLYISDGDAGIESYQLLQGDDISNWLLIEGINKDTTEIYGRFQLSFITMYSIYLSGERERWDDPNRPDTLHFTNGEFRAEYLDN